MNNIVKVEFIFENCESLTYEAADIAKIAFFGLSKQFSKYSGSLHKNHYVSAFEFILKNKSIPCNEKLHSPLDTPTFRFKDRDIAQICFIYEDESHETYLVKWPKGDTCTHSKQQYNMSLKGNIHFTSYIKKKHFKKFATIEMVDYFS